MPDSGGGSAPFRCAENNDLLSLFSVQPQVVASRPRLQVRDLILTRVRSTTRGVYAI